MQTVAQIMLEPTSGERAVTGKVLTSFYGVHQMAINGKIAVFVGVDKDQPDEDRNFVLIHNGDPVPTGYSYLGSALDAMRNPTHVFVSGRLNG